MEKLEVLVVGAGVAGPVAAYWLARGGTKVTVIDRAPTLLKTGQGIDVEGPAREIVQKMGLLDAITAMATKEEGFAIADDEGQKVATIGGGLTQEIEIMRGDLSGILCNAADQFELVQFQYGRSIRALDQTSTKVNVTFDDGEQAAFGAVIAADGMRSKTRDLAFGQEASSSAFVARDHYCAYFNVAYDESDWPHSRWQNASEGRSILLRPVDKQRSSAYLMQMNKNDALEQACHESKEKQKTALREAFEDVGGLAPRVVQGMMETDNFYFERLAQIKMKDWSVGRVVVVGDAAYAPSAVTGQGVILAMLGAYVLAGELNQNKSDPAVAFKAYDQKCRAHVEKAQTIPLGGYAPRLGNPTTSFGIWTLRTSFKILAWSGIWKLFNPKGEEYKLPEYPSMMS